ncbi:MAG: spore coat biosynthesis protein F [Magnetovibrio sp.]|nr:spore coat biosynthesis protein F [Magnetovibrio sp.]
MTLKRRIYATIEARMTSSRLPGKVLMQAAGKPMLEHMIERISRAQMLDGIVVATTKNKTDDPIVELADRMGVGCFRGSEVDVLGRVLCAARTNNVDVIVETTGDCPLIDPSLIDLCINSFLDTDVDYVSNILHRTFPVGMDIQVFSTDVLADVAKRTSEPDDREHVSLYIYRHPEIYTLKNIPASDEFARADLSLTLDTQADFDLLRIIFEKLYPVNPLFGLSEIIALIESNPDLTKINSHVRRNHV